MHKQPGFPPEGSTTGGVEGGVVVGQVHEAVHQVWLTHVSGQGAQLLVGGQAAAPGSLPHGPLLKHLGLASQLYSSTLPGTTYISNSDRLKHFVPLHGLSMGSLALLQLAAATLCWQHTILCKWVCVS